MKSQQQLFIKAVAEYLVNNEVGKSIALKLESQRKSVLIPWAAEWQKVRSLSPIFGYTSVSDAEKQLTEFLRGIK